MRLIPTVLSCDCGRKFAITNTPNGIMVEELTAPTTQPKVPIPGTPFDEGQAPKLAPPKLPKSARTLQFTAHAMAQFKEKFGITSRKDLWDYICVNVKRSEVRVQMMENGTLIIQLPMFALACGTIEGGLRVLTILKPEEVASHSLRPWSNFQAGKIYMPGGLE